MRVSAAQQAMQQNASASVMSLFGSEGVQQQQPYLVLSIERSNLLQHTLNILSQVPDRDLRKELKVVFQGEEGVDAGGVRSPHRGRGQRTFLLARRSSPSRPQRACATVRVAARAPLRSALLARPPVAGG